MAKTEKISTKNLTLFCADILDIFEEFLEERGIEIPNPEKDERIAEGADPDSLCTLYGTDYGNLMSEIEGVLYSWKLAEEPY